MPKLAKKINNICTFFSKAVWGKTQTFILLDYINKLLMCQWLCSAFSLMIYITKRNACICYLFIKMWKFVFSLEWLWFSDGLGRISFNHYILTASLLKESEEKKKEKKIQTNGIIKSGFFFLILYSVSLRNVKILKLCRSQLQFHKNFNVA